mmetsp:Transcript_135834/g.321938  ORF Transcript_135834/g.321938 Transcript_135834/m.321938 type:complete len:371 (-) Transcript_135834:191-1303(-)
MGLSVPEPAWQRLVPGVRVLPPPLEENRRQLRFLDPRVLLVNLSAQDVHHPVCGVLVLGHDQTEALKVGLGPEGRPDVGEVASGAQQHDVIQQREEAVARLMDDHDDRHAQLGQALQLLNQDQGAIGVQTGGRLVQEQDGRARCDLQANVHALALAPTQALAGGDPVPHDHVLLGLELQHLHHVVRDLPDPVLLGARGHPLHRGEGDVLPDRQPFVNRVILGDKADDRLQVLYALLLPVDEQVASDRPLGVGVFLARQHVDEGGLSTPRGAHDGREVARQEGAAEVVQHHRHARVGLHGALDVPELQGGRLELPSDASELVGLKLLDACVGQDLLKKRVRLLEPLQLHRCQLIPTFGEPLVGVAKANHEY